MAKYTLEEVKELIDYNQVNSSNFMDIIDSLLPYDFNDEISDIFKALASNEELPEAIRTNLQNAVNSYEEIVHREEQEEEEKQEEIIEEIPHQGEAPEAQEPSEESKESKDVIFDEPNIDTIELPEEQQEASVTPDNGPYSSSDDSYKELPEKEDSTSLKNDEILGAITAYAFYKGIKIASSNPGLNGKPQISFELDENSKPYLDHLLLQLYQSNDALDVNMTRVEATKQELLTIQLSNDLSLEKMEQNGKEMFEKIDSILRDTDQHKNYEEKMPLELKALKDKFVNDDPNIPEQDFKVGYLNQNGENTFYLVANSKIEALELANLMGYEVKEDRGGNVFELDTEGRIMEGNKLDNIASNINTLDEVKNIKNGISDVDIDYNRNHYTSREESIKNFIGNSSSPDTMAIVQVDIPNSTPNQRIVSLASEDGYRETIVFDNGKEFDDHTLPKIVDSFGDGATVNQENVVKVKFDDKASYEALSNHNTYLRLNNYEPSVVDKIDGQIEKVNQQDNHLSNTTLKAKPYQKSLGTYPTRDPSETGKTSFATIAVFLFVLLLGLLLIYLIY